MNQEPTLRRWQPADAAAIAEIHNESIAANDATMDERLRTTEEKLAELEALGPREDLLVCDDPSQGVVGFGVIKHYSDRAGYRFAADTGVFFRRDSLRRGLGTRMKKAIIERARELGYHHLVAKIFADNEASIRYNLKLGYELVGIQRKIGFKEGRWKDVAILQLVLEDGEESSSATKELEGGERE